MNQPSTASIDQLLDQIESDRTIFDLAHMHRRLDALDQLDQLDTGDSPFHLRAGSLRARLEGINSRLFLSLRNRILSGDDPAGLLQWISAFGVEASGHTEGPARGIGYDYLDDLVSGILQFAEPSVDSNLRLPDPEMVFYQPTPARHILSLVSTLTPSDVLIDLGSGLGHVTLLAAILTRAHSIGIEIEPAYVATAQAAAASLHLTRATFLLEDVRTADLSRGTVFHLYSPFTGSIFTTVLERLRRQSTLRPIRICTLGPCTPQVALEPWLNSTSPPVEDQVVTFHPAK
jgi:Methyltransferase domain